MLRATGRPTDRLLLILPSGSSSHSAFLLFHPPILIPPPSVSQVSRGKVQENAEEWVTEVIMAGPNYAGSPEHAALYAQILPDRPHKEPIFARAGILEYK